MITISLCMIVKNEEAVLARCLDSIADLVDEIIIVDTGSTDATKEIAAEYTSLIYDFPWNFDFSEARNFSFSKASMEYIYAADADEVLEGINRERFLFLKQTLLTEIEIVQMKYVTKNQFNTVLNFRDEYRPKLFRRLRSFTWIDPIHETVRLDPVVFDSDIEITHLPQSLHSKRDFQGFQRAWNKDGRLSTKLHRMYAKELLMTGDISDFSDALPVFLHTVTDPATDADSMREGVCILAHFYRISENTSEFFKYALKEIAVNPCSEICYELGEFYLTASDYNEAVIWYYNAVYETSPILNVHFHGDTALLRLAECYEALSAKEEERQMQKEYLNKANEYRTLSAQWELPSDDMPT